MKLPDIASGPLVRILILLFSGAASSIADESYSYRNLADQLDDLAYRNNIVIDGLELTASQPPQRVPGDPGEQVKRLLVEFNYVTILSSEQSIERIIILGEKPVIPRGIILHTQKVGKNHTIQGRITGGNGKQIDVSLVVDTGADYLVLPSSMMESFEIDPDAAETRKLQTANGLTEARVARVTTLQIGSELIPDIEAAFIQDDQLGDIKLLGMNVLQRYRITLDDQQQTITLIKVE